MFGLKRQSIKAKLLVPALTALLMFVTALSLFWSGRYSKSHADAFKGQSDLMIELSVQPLASAVWAFDAALAKTTLAALEAADGLIFASVVADGSAFAIHMPSDPEAIELTEEMQGWVDQLLSGEETTATYGMVMLRRAPVTSGEDVLGELIIGVDETAIKAAVSQARLVALVLGLAAFLIFSVILVLVSQIVTKPLAGIVTRMTELLDGNTEFDVPEAARRDEFGLVGRVIAESRDALRETQRRAEEEALQKAEKEMVFATLSELFEALAAGDFSRRLDMEFPVEYTALKRDLNRTVDNLSELIGSVVSATGNVQDRAQEISSSSSYLAERTERQAATLVETTSAIDELTSTLQTSAESAAEVEDFVKVARTDAIDTGDAVKKAVSAMNEIESSSEAITRIVTVIDDIAFQTNLLALNAGVEAARAGETGRGFAVVALEVRGLAQRSAEAAREIRELIETSSNHVSDGVELVVGAGEALSGMVERVGKISEQVAAVVSAMKSQAIGLSDVNSGMSELDDVTKENTNMVDRSALA
ncbi:MAG: methyl-accepting chemotaxis protein, partial [Pseudomonadota bacterium]